MATSTGRPPSGGRRRLLLLLLLPSAVLLQLTTVSAIGVNYGTLGDNLPPPAQVADFIKTQTIINRVKIYDTNPDIIRAFANTGIALTITAGNGDIPALTQIAFARQWVANNIAPFYPQTRIIRVLVGNEILHWGGEELISNLVPAMRTLRDALNLAGFKSIQVIHLAGVFSFHFGNQTKGKRVETKTKTKSGRHWLHFIQSNQFHSFPLIRADQAVREPRGMSRYKF